VADVSLRHLPDSAPYGAGGRVLLAFGLSFDEIVVTTFTSPPKRADLPLWIFGNLFRRNPAPIVDVVAAVLIVLPLWPSQRLGDDTTMRGG
jgi:putative spermidine/putrescine transport system permease protein